MSDILFKKTQKPSIKPSQERDLTRESHNIHEIWCCTRTKWLSHFLWQFPFRWQRLFDKPSNVTYARVMINTLFSLTSRWCDWKLGDAEIFFQTFLLAVAICGFTCRMLMVYSFAFSSNVGQEYVTWELLKLVIISFRQKLPEKLKSSTRNFKFIVSRETLRRITQIQLLRCDIKFFVGFFGKLEKSVSLVEYFYLRRNIILLLFTT